MKSDQKDEARTRRDNAIECLKYRKLVYQTYTEALEKLGRENDNDLKEFVEKIINTIKASQPGHAVAITQTENRRDKCDELLR